MKLRSDTPSGDGSTSSITLAGGALGFNWLPVFVAQRQNIFLRRGLDVTLQRLGSVEKATAAVRAGQAHLAITPPEGAIADNIAGGGLRIIAGNANRLPMSLVANSRFKKIEDLKGRVLGTSSMTEGTAIYTREILAQRGLNYPGDYEFALVGVHPERWQALQEGKIDAAVQPVPLNFAAIDAGYSNLCEVSDVIPEIVFTAIIGDAAWLAQYRTQVKAILESLIEATDIVYDSSKDADLVPILMDITRSNESYSRRTLQYMREKRLFPRNLEIPDAAMAKTLELMVKANLLDPGDKGRARSVIDPSYINVMAVN
jgi:ABC-type nitrate/sulfonate/bicarbonate transport system substrate-binding protein